MVTVMATVMVMVTETKVMVTNMENAKLEEAFLPFLKRS